MSRRLEIRNADDPRDAIHQAVQRLAQGELVGFPTETVYVLAAHALRPQAVERLAALAGNGASPQGAALCLALKSADEALDYVPRMGPVARRLSRRCWPGPVVLAFQPGDEGLAAQFPDETRRHVVPQGELRLRVPAHDCVLEALRLMPAPLVTSGERPAGRDGPVDARQLEERFGADVALVFDDGPSRYGQPSTVVRISEDCWETVERGVVGQTTIGRLASEIYLFVCTGNTCRSPMAEALFRKFLSERLKCTEEELIDRGFIVASAGLSAAVGAAAAPEAIELLARAGIDLRTHASQPLTDALLDQADHVFTMTRGHRDSILALRPDVADRVHLISSDKTDVADPIGGGLDDYRVCKEQLERYLRALVRSRVLPH
ncbi:MAG TPA: Sua5/YciO/YrdC/YwlC family protein [Planctomycetaceae bacterium]|nr:Sua5/YciO/YrdC/YwlC family protein [Planctomycetaceae bacterium]